MAEDNVTNTFNQIFVLYPEHTPTDLLYYSMHTTEIPILTSHMGNL